MSTTISAVQSKVNQFIRDSTTNSVSAADRLAAISMAVQDLMTEFGFDQTNQSYMLDYLDGITDYKLGAALPDFLETVNVERETGYYDIAWSRKSVPDIRIDINNSSAEPSFAIERVDRGTNLIINLPNPRYSSTTVHNCDNLTSDGTWVLDAVTSDATNLTVDTNEYKEGVASFNFDVDVSQSANNKATIKNSTLSAKDWSNYEDLASIVFRVYLPTVTYFSSFTIYWGSSTSNYWSVSATLDYMGNSFAAGWNRVKVDWSSATPVGNPDSSAITYFAIDYNYTASQGDDTDYRLDDIFIVQPEELKFTYQAYVVGTTSAGVELYAFTATGDIPFYSGQYDHFDNYVAHKAASTLFKQMGLYNDALAEEAEVSKLGKALRVKFPSSILKVETRSFKIRGLTFRRKGQRNIKIT